MSSKKSIAIKKAPSKKLDGETPSSKVKKEDSDEEISVPPNKKIHIKKKKEKPEEEEVPKKSSIKKESKEASKKALKNKEPEPESDEDEEEVPKKKSSVKKESKEVPQKKSSKNKEPESDEEEEVPKKKKSSKKLEPESESEKIPMKEPEPDSESEPEKESTDCDICAAKFNKVKKSKVSCPQCHAIACNECYRQYFLTLVTSPKCMYCSVAFNVEFLRTTFPKTFVDKDLRAHQENILLIREKSFLPETQAEIAARSAHSEAIAKISKKKDEETLHLRTQLSKIGAEIKVAQRNPDKLSLTAVRKIIDDKKATQKKLLASYNKICDKYIEQFDSVKKINDKEAVKMTRHCPTNECRGFLDEKWFCSLCKHETCENCFVTKYDNHECKKDDIKTAKELKKNTKNCPKCGISIFKIEGCPQMFCTSCHTAFDWETLKIETGRIHNPHYFDYVKKNGHIPRQIGDLPCGGLPQSVDVSHLRPSQNKLANDILRMVLDFEAAHLRTSNELAHMRFSYLRGHLNEKDWKTMIYREEKNNQKLQMVHDIKKMVVLVSNDIYRKLVEAKTKSEAKEAFAELTNLIIYSNEQFYKVSKMFNTSVIYMGTSLTDNWMLQRYSIFEIKDFNLALSKDNLKDFLHEAKKLMKAHPEFLTNVPRNVAIADDEDDYADDFDDIIRIF
jgi:predicted lactoylglutathione lyase